MWRAWRSAPRAASGKSAGVSCNRPQSFAGQRAAQSPARALLIEPQLAVGHILTVLEPGAARGIVDAARNLIDRLTHAGEPIPCKRQFADLLVPQPAESMQPLAGLVVHRMRREKPVWRMRAVPQDERGPILAVILFLPLAVHLLCFTWNVRVLHHLNSETLIGKSEQPGDVCGEQEITVTEKAPSGIEG